MSTPARLIWERSSGGTTEFPLDGEAFEIGRDRKASIRIDEPLVSRRHARIERRGGGWIVTDLGSTNFTRLNGQRVRRECDLADGDELRFGRARCRFVLAQAQDSPTGAQGSPEEAKQEPKQAGNGIA